MKCKLIGLLIITSMLTMCVYKNDKINTINDRIVKVEQNVNCKKKTDEEIELEYWSDKLGREGIVANNMLQMGTDIYLEGYGLCEILDRGGKGFNNYSNFDVFVEREYGESDSSYYNRIQKLGVKNTDGYIIEFLE